MSTKPSSISWSNPRKVVISLSLDAFRRNLKTTLARSLVRRNWHGYAQTLPAAHRNESFKVELKVECLQLKVEQLAHMKADDANGVPPHEKHKVFGIALQCGRHFSPIDVRWPRAAIKCDVN